MVTGLTSGCFDLFHFSHLLYLQRCRSHCDRLIVGVDSDELVKKSKGDLRPIIPENERLELIANLGIVHKAFILKQVEDLDDVAKKFGVARVFKHQSFWNMDNVYGIRGTGAELVIVQDIPGMISTSQIIDRIINRYGKKLSDASRQKEEPT